MSDINPNTPVTDAISTEIVNNDGPLTFDELESVMAKPKASKAAKETKDYLTAEVDGKIKNEPKEEKDEVEESEEDGQAEEKAEKKKDNGKKEAKELEKAEEKARKILKARLADKDFDIDEEAVVTVKVNGKEEQVPIKELLGNYSGKVSWEKKFSEVGNLQQKVRAQDAKLAEQKAKIKEMFEQEDPQVRLFKMAELSGVNPVQFRQQFLDENVKLVEKWYSMSEDERKADALQFENTYLKHQQETKDKDSKARQATEALDKEIQTLRQTHNVKQDEFLEYYDQVESLVNSGKLTKDHLNPKFIVESIQKDRLWNAALPAIESLGWSEQEKGQKLSELVEKAYAVGVKPEDIPEAISEIYGSKRSQKIVSQKVKEREEFMTGKKQAVSGYKKGSEALFFDDII